VTVDFSGLTVANLATHVTIAGEMAICFPIVPTFTGWFRPYISKQWISAIP